MTGRTTIRKNQHRHEKSIYLHNLEILDFAGFIGRVEGLNPKHVQSATENIKVI